MDEMELKQRTKNFAHRCVKLALSLPNLSKPEPKYFISLRRKARKGLLYWINVKIFFASWRLCVSYYDFFHKYSIISIQSSIKNGGVKNENFS